MAALRKLKTGATEAVSPEELHLRITIARLLALSYGECELTAEMYGRAAALDDERRRRL
jgi:hypothetical protein